MKKEEQILYDAETSARFVENIKGWIDKNNRFFGNNPKSEHMARYSSCTHQKCECGNLMEKGYTKCEECRAKAAIERYNNLPFREWDGNEMVYSGLADEYFHDEADIIDYCEDNEVDSKDLRLVICEPNYFRSVPEDFFEDALPEDTEGLPEKLEKAINVLNNVIASLPPASYSPGKIRTEFIITE